MVNRHRILFLCCFLLACRYGVQAQHTLHEYVALAQKNSPLLQDNANQSKINDLELARIKAQYTKAQIGLSANYLFAPIISKDGNKVSFRPNEYNADEYYGYDLAASNGGTYQGLVNFSQPLFNAGVYHAYAEQAALNKAVNQNKLKLNAHDIEKLVTDQYLLCLLDKQQMQFADSMAQLLQTQIDIVSRLTENGVMKKSDLSLLHIEHKSNEGLFVQYRATYKRDLIDLNLLCNIDDSSFVLLDDVVLTIGAAAEEDNYLHQFRLDSLNAIAAQKVIETKYKPQLSFYSNAGLNAVYAPVIPKRFGLSAGINFSWNLFDGHQKSITRSKTELQLASISSYKSSFLLQNKVKKNKILTEIQSYNTRKLAAEQVLEEYDQLMKAYRQEMMQGQLPIVNYISTLKNMVAARRDYYLMNTNKLLLINAYNYWNW